MKNIFSILSMVLLGSVATSISAQGWTFLGSAKVHGVGVDHDEILVTGMQGDFSAIKLFVENEGIEFERVVVHFGNGGQQELIIRDFIPAGGETRVLDLTGHDRVIRTVDFYYKSNRVTKRKAKVKLFGRR
ncbi:MAG TPA: hypothetical protein VFG10_12435 [Saprospiraceae bacterium]|nr:hypothetical protein [Saprospiraceae bacterium]